MSVCKDLLNISHIGINLWIIGQGGHYSWKLLECNLTPGKTAGKLLKKSGSMCLLPKCSSFINAKLPHTHKIIKCHKIWKCYKTDLNCYKNKFL